MSHPTVGHIHLRVANLDRAITFYCDVLGFDLTLRMGDQAAFLGAGGYHHHIGLNTWESRDGTPPPPGHTGLYHSAFLYPDRAALGSVIKRVLAAGIPLEGAADHGVSEAVYLSDPEGNGVELYRDRPRDDWKYDAQGNLKMGNARLDVQAIIDEAREPWTIRVRFACLDLGLGGDHGDRFFLGRAHILACRRQLCRHAASWWVGTTLGRRRSARKPRDKAAP